jgi:hypothetical protein
MAKLTEQEQQEVIRFVEAGKPLPDKYRFLLFDDKREVELVWNGKTSEVTNVVLPFQVIEQVDEPRAEKPEDLALQAGLFDERGRQLKGWTNKLISGDNKLILSPLKNGPLREEIEVGGGLRFGSGRRLRSWTRRCSTSGRAATQGDGVVRSPGIWLGLVAMKGHSFGCLFKRFSGGY